MTIEAFDHYTVRAAELAASRRFYEEALELRCEQHHAFGFDLLHAYAGERALVHILQTGEALDRFMARSAPSYGSGVERQTGNFEHVAFNATGLPEMRERLRRLGYVFRERPLGDNYQLLLQDPDGVEIEINFPAGEAG